MPRRRGVLVACLAIALLSLLAFWPILGNGFVDYDDPVYLTANEHVQQGLSGSSLEWAWTSTQAANWHPLTWMSHMLDWELFGPDPRGHHAMSLLFHVLATLFLFLALERATRSQVPSAFVAALFAVHPLHVESVAWAAERKDVLSTFLWMFATWCYVRWTEDPRPRRYVLVLAAFALGLAAKPMLVTLPFTLLLLDFWPLSRWGAAAIPRSRIIEKVPLFVLSAASSIVTVVVQRRGQAVAAVDVFPLADRVQNAVVSCVGYLAKTAWPGGLSFFYPHPRQGLATWQVAGAALLLALVSFVAFRERARRPYLLVGWLFYLGTLLPVIGLVQVGSQGMANRYTYVPLVGIFVMVAWGIPDLLRIRETRWLVAAAVAIVVVLALACRVEAGYWRDSATLFSRALEVNPDNYLAHYGLGIVRAKEDRTDEAIRHYETAARLRPDYGMTHNSLARLLVARGRLDEAYIHAREAVRYDPGRADAHYNLATVLGKQGKTEEAIREFRETLRLEPGVPRVHNNLGNALARLGRMEEAIREFQSAIALDPRYGVAQANLAAALLAVGRREEASRAVRRARELGFEPPAELVRELEAF